MSTYYLFLNKNMKKTVYVQFIFYSINYLLYQFALISTTNKL